jgi:dTDP-4-amino-4,6-dideoxygalactose transaminase
MKTKKLLSGEGKNIPLFKVFMPKTVMEPLSKTLFSGYIGEGPIAEEFERKLTPWFANDNVLTLCNGTAGLQLALRLADVGFGDEVISTPMTCSATNEPIMAMGAKIIWADIDPWTANIDPLDVAKKITSKTKAIMCVHWGGYPCELNELNAIAAKHGIKLIEDACHALGSTYYDKPIGSHSDFACFSFQAIKLMNTVDGGSLVCKSKTDCERGRLLRWYGIDRKAERKDLRCEADILEYGYKFHMNDVIATIGLEQLKYLSETIRKTRFNAIKYDAAFKYLKAVKLLKYSKDRISAYWLYTIRVRDRLKFMEHMKAKGITVSQVHVRNDGYTMFKDFKADLPGVDEFTSEQVSIPVGWWLTEKELEHIINAVAGYDQIMR